MRVTSPRLLRNSYRLCANPAATPFGSNSPLKTQPLNLLPPIPLYRRLFRAHRHKLPTEERLLGDQYIKAEFRAHRNVENPVHIVGFLTEWQLYAQKLEGDNWRDIRMEESKVEKMSDEQIGQLYELMQAVQKHGSGESGEGEGEGGTGPR